MDKIARALERSLPFACTGRASLVATSVRGDVLIVGRLGVLLYAHTSRTLDGESGLEALTLSGGSISQHEELFSVAFNASGDAAYVCAARWVGAVIVPQRSRCGSAKRDADDGLVPWPLVEFPSADRAPFVEARWHAHADDRLAVLDGDGVLRVWDVFPRCGDAAEHSVAADDFYELELDDCASFAFGGAAGWARFGVIAVSASARLVALCPVAPCRALVPRECVESLRSVSSGSGALWLEETFGRFGECYGDEASYASASRPLSAARATTAVQLAAADCGCCARIAQLAPLGDGCVVAVAFDGGRVDIVLLGGCFDPSSDGHETLFCATLESLRVCDDSALVATLERDARRRCGVRLVHAHGVASLEVKWLEGLLEEGALGVFSRRSRERTERVSGAARLVAEQPTVTTHVLSTLAPGDGSAAPKCVGVGIGLVGSRELLVAWFDNGNAAACDAAVARYADDEFAFARSGQDDDDDRDEHGTETGCDDKALLRLADEVHSQLAAAKAALSPHTHTHRAPRRRFHKIQKPLVLLVRSSGRFLFKFERERESVAFGTSRRRSIPHVAGFARDLDVSKDAALLADARERLESGCVLPLATATRRAEALAQVLAMMRDAQRAQLMEVTERVSARLEMLRRLRDETDAARERASGLCERAASLLTAARELRPTLSRAEREYARDLQLLETRAARASDLVAADTRRAQALLKAEHFTSKALLPDLSNEHTEICTHILTEQDLILKQIDAQTGTLSSAIRRDQTAAV